MSIPDYLQEEIEKFKYNKKHGIPDIATEENAYAFINLAYSNNRITKDEANKLKNMLDIL